MTKNFKLPVLVMAVLAVAGCGTVEQHQEAAERAKAQEKRVAALKAEIAKENSPAGVLDLLRAGNARFVADSCRYRPDCHNVSDSASSQKMLAAVVACCETSIPMERLFDQKPGRLFVIRTIGNSLCGSSAQGSVDYAVAHLGAKAVVVLGHEGCGGVACALDDSVKSADGREEQLLPDVQADLKAYIGKKDSLDAAIRLNAKNQVARLMESKRLQQLVEEGKLTLKAGFYNVRTGRVEF